MIVAAVVKAIIFKMKYFQLCFIVIFLSACSGTKRVVENSKKETSEIKIIDSINRKTEKAIDNIVNIIVEEVDKPINLKTNDSFIVSNNTEPIKGSIIKPHHKELNKLFKQFVSDQGLVSYVEFKKRQLDLGNYISYLGKIMPTNKWTKEDKLAYWINAYNAMTIDLILRNYPIKSIKDIKNPWEQRYWKLGEKWYNLDEIEHQILRKMNEPRIHFAIVCASYSCPKLQNEAFTTANLEQQLTKATKEFLNDSERNSISENNIELSKIFQWFSKDFKQNGSLIDFLNQYSDIKISDKAKTSFKNYNWILNE